LTKLNLRTYEIHTWELREGKITITVPSLIEPDADELAAILAAA